MITVSPLAPLGGPLTQQAGNTPSGPSRATGRQAEGEAFGRLLNEDHRRKDEGPATGHGASDEVDPQISSPLLAGRLQQTLTSDDRGIPGRHGETRIKGGSDKSLSDTAEANEQADNLAIAGTGQQSLPQTAAVSVHPNDELGLETGLANPEPRRAGTEITPKEPHRNRVLDTANMPTGPARGDGANTGQTKLANGVVAPELPVRTEAEGLQDRSAVQAPSPQSDPAIASLEKARTPRSEAIGLQRTEKTRSERGSEAETAAQPKNAPPAANAAQAAPIAAAGTAAISPSMAAAGLDQAANSLSHAISQQLTVSQIQEFNGGATKVLKLQLQPAHLGKIEIVLTDNKGRLSVQIQTGSLDAQSTLTREKASLRTALDEANLTVEALSIEAPKDRRASIASLAQADSSINQAQQGAGERFDGHRSSGQADDNRSRQPSSGFAEAGEAGSDDRSDGGSAGGRAPAGLRI
ncbi:hypothetical protein B7H23_06035 [Notoacmeibacter marinus]|uniref:Flagellar hook-length control protein-like C-terminal domain-containing protein n=1 Tax=Notoacmeibacter marinus TaxID=1876515 RepID=A0A231V2R9_9HYPH|nr:flagellar hook-length control protein FliK [Notoacmeibacter marinus]OXT02454.1 hypothetical protein B7H23_06035 [Notoacmeibacter marinus]